MRFALAFAFVSLAVGCPAPTVETPDADAGPPDAGKLDPKDTGAAPDATVADGAAPDATVADGAAPDATVADGGDPDPDAGTSPDAAQRVVNVVVAYGATADEPLLAELFLTASSAQRTKVTPTLAGGAMVGSKGEPRIVGLSTFEWSYRGAGLVYVAQQDVFDVEQLYFAPTPGHVATGTTARLSLPSVTTDANDYHRLPNSDWLVFTQAFGSNFSSLFAARTTTTTQPMRLLSQGRSASFRAASPTARQVAFVDIIVSANDRDLWFADLDAVPPRTERINPGAHFGVASVTAWSPDGTEIIYVADETADRFFELFRVPVVNGALGPRTRVFPTAARGHSFGAGAYAASGGTIAFVADMTTANYGDLFTMSALSPSPTPTKVTGAFVGPTFSGVDRFQFGPDEALIAYAADQARPTVDELYVARVGVADSGTPINGATGTGPVAGERWLDATHLLYVAGEFGSRSTFIVDVTGGTPATPIEIPGGAADRFEVSRSGRYLITHTAAGELQVVDLTASPLTAVNLGPGRGWCWGADDTLAVIATVGDATTADLYLVEDLGDPASLLQISGPLVADGVVTGCAFPP